jgi:TMEM175 potassium channel family protein
MEGSSDGVFGFAATLLVLDLAVHPPGTPLQQVLHAWPGYLAYLVSFLIIGGAWLLPTALTGRADQLFLRLNPLLLLVVVRSGCGDRARV